MVKTSAQNTPQDTPEPQLGMRRKIEDDDPANRATKKARTRVSYSCGECHRRKQKCDRQIPCSHCIARKVPELCKAYTPGKSDQDLHARLARVEQVLATALPQYWAQGGGSSNFSDVNGDGGRHRSGSPSGEDDRGSQADDEDVGVFESGRWFGASASGIVAAPAMIEKLQTVVESPAPSERERGHSHSVSIDQLPPDIFHSESKALLGPSESTPADNLKRLVQECGVSPHKISELLHELPPRQMTDKLVDFYFTHINWTRYPVSERNFRLGYNSIYSEGTAINPNEFRFLPLLFVILAISSTARRSYLYHADRSYALVLGRPSAIQDDYTSTLPPANVEDQDNVITRGPMPLTTPTKMTYIVLRHTLSGIMGRMVHHFQKVNSPRHYAEVCAIDDDLLKFIQALPPFYSLDPDTSLDETYHFIPAHRFLLVTEILFVRITLHRPYLLRRLSSDRYLRSRTACFECAMKDFMIRRRFLEATAKDVRDPVTSAYREFQAAMISGIYLVLYPKGKDAETMNMILDGFIHDHERDGDETTRRELKIIQFLKMKSTNILKGSPKTEEAHIVSSPSEKPHPDAQLLLQLHQSSPRPYVISPPRVAGPSFPNGNTPGEMTSPVPYNNAPQYPVASGSTIPAVHQLQRADSASVQSGSGSPGHDEDTAAQSLLDQWCNVFSGGPAVEGLASAQGLPWGTPALGDLTGLLTSPSQLVGGSGAMPDADGTDWSYWESLVNQIRSGPVA
ncbi:hypothetical protein EIP86_006395 [Pleurotus ostreatoroseus]|nr:hypothetical protein EIP86_006395 [Pleurotus ostreatoroseus]